MDNGRVRHRAIAYIAAEILKYEKTIHPVYLWKGQGPVKAVNS